MFKAACEKNGVAPDSIRFTPAQGLGNLAAMVQGGQVDVAAGASTGFLPLLAEGQIQLMGWAGDAQQMQLSALATRADMVETRRDAIEAILITRPQCRWIIAGSAFLQKRYGMVRLMKSMWSQKSSSKAMAGRGSALEPMAALLTRISTDPSS